MRLGSDRNGKGVDTDVTVVLCISGYICSSKLVPVSQYVGTVLVCLLGVACLRGETTYFKLLRLAVMNSSHSSLYITP